MSNAAESSSAAAARVMESHFLDAPLVDIQPDNSIEVIPDSRFIIPKRQPLPEPYVSPIIFTDPPQLSKEIWCPSLVDRIENEYSAASANFLYSLPRKLPALRDHSECSIKRCTANNTDAENYKCVHWKDCADEGNCTFIGPNDQDVMKIIADGGIPLVSIRHSLTGGLTFKVVRATFKSKFFAVSHVWSGGLGNPQANQLPMCQIMRLYNIGIELESDTFRKGCFSKCHISSSMLKFLKRKKQKCLLWIDTLCIPVNNKSLRMMAINSMARIYAAAQSIAILDHELQQLQVKAAWRGEIFGYLFCSAWASRCWTFQEGSMAKEWIVQFDDGLCSIDALLKAEPESLEERLGDSFPYPPPGPDESTVPSDMAQWFGKMPRLQDRVGSYTFSSQSRFSLFVEVWNNLCLRTTTQKDDLIYIVAIMLDLRPSEVEGIPPQQRLLSIFNAQEKLPIGFLFRERDEVTSWQQACRWLPSNIEERSVDQNETFLRRRSPEENFFVFECSPAQRFFFTKVSMGNERLLHLTQPSSDEKFLIQFLLSSGLDLPKINICIMMSDSLTWFPGNDRDEIISHSEFNRRLHIEEVTESFGVCLGVRKSADDYVQFFYICPVKCVSDYNGVLGEGMISASVDDHPCLKAGMECVIEHDFSSAHALSQLRPPFTLSEQLRTSCAFLLIPYCVLVVFWVPCYFLTVPKQWSLLQIFFIYGIRFLAFAIEIGLLAASISQIEFDDWLTNLYRDKVNIPYTAFSIHYPPAITIGILSLSSLLLLLSVRLTKGNDAWHLVSRFVEIELGILLLRWFLELYAHAPAKINLLLAPTSFVKNKRQIMTYYNMFYAPSRFTLSLRRLALIMKRNFEQLKIFPPSDVFERVLEDGDNSFSHALPEEGGEQQPLLLPWSEASGLNKGKQADKEPWRNDPIGPYTSNTHQRIMDIQSSGRSAVHLDDLAPLNHLSSLLVFPYAVLTQFWFIFTLIIHVCLSGYHRVCLVTFAILQSIVTPLEGFLFAARVKRLLAQPDHASRPNLSKMHISIHYNATITAVILILCPIFLVLGFNSDGWILITIALALLFEVMQLALRYFIEFSARGMGSCNFLGPILKKTNHRAVGFGNSDLDLDSCFYILYRASRLSRWIEAVERFILPFAVTNAYWDRLAAQNAIPLIHNENDVQASQEDRDNSLLRSISDVSSENSDEQALGRGSWARFTHGCERGALAGRQAVKPLTSGAKTVLKPVYLVAARSLAVLDSVARLSLRMGNSRVGAGRDDYGDDGENLMREDLIS